ncbi:AraC-like DNA-binding protein [Pseudomonas marginalis]|uniref:AraC family transcriptional regulator n=1 Tax=Pseudomonas marginalis TaxID=298 RepID=UPI00209E434C|nr:AraC family transcriptional regulator [Pseudomonas marginalis]MCP1507719.1 AraC-like DNA-binding protein [Pseudomonas marginalis]MCP1525223.1 AraC-like DNA-binding protein [Pseudomonas marginalis]MDQ0500182.1 AraC-like DNA-binding protein [Pseudomonas marginalis]
MQTNSHVVGNIRVDQFDFSGAQAWMERICGPHSLRATKPQDIRFRHSAKVFNSFSTALGFMEYGADVTVKIEESDCLNSYSLSLPLMGEQKLMKNGKLFNSYTGSGLIVSPHETQELWMAGNCRKLSIVIPRMSMRQTLEEMLHRTLDVPLRFEPVIDAINGATASWWRLVRNFAEEFERGGGVFEHAIFSRDIEAALIKGLILSQRNNYSDLINEHLQCQLPYYLIKARDYIHNNARENICLEDIERASGVSRFKVFDGFKKYFGMPPMAYLKKYRLTAVRREILEGGPVKSLSLLATDWGFNHLGRFAIEYRKLFNETPSSTLHRGEMNRERFL